MSTVILGFAILWALACVLLGWTVPLIAGFVRRRRGKGGQVLIGIGAVWALLAAGGAGFGVWSCIAFRQSCKTETFCAGSYAGAVGRLTLPYDGSGHLYFRQEGADGKKGGKRWVTAVTNGVASAPAGRLSVSSACVSVTNALGEVAGQITCSVVAKNGACALETNGTCHIPGGFPLCASVEPSKSDGQLYLNFKMVDTAGNKIMWQGMGEGRKTPAFEAVSPAGDCFWRDDFEYG